MKRRANPKRQQLVCVLADNSGSMRGEKAEAATNGVREMLMHCQGTGPPGRVEWSCYRFVLIRFGDNADIYPGCNVRNVREIDPATITLRGDGRGTNIPRALELAYEGLERYLHEVLEHHPERDKHPLPLLLLFSDGHNGHGKPIPVAERIKRLRFDGEPVVIATAGVATNPSDPPDEELLTAIASTPECYFRIEHAAELTQFLAEVGSSGASSPAEIARIIDRLRLTGQRTIEG